VRGRRQREEAIRWPSKKGKSGVVDLDRPNLKQGRAALAEPEGTGSPASPEERGLPLRRGFEDRGGKGSGTSSAEIIEGFGKLSLLKILSNRRGREIQKPRLSRGGYRSVDHGERRAEA